MTQQPSIFDVLQHLSSSVPGCLMMSVVDVDSGMSLAAVHHPEIQGVDAADAYHGELYRLIERSMSMLESSQGVEHLVLVGDGAIYLSSPLPNTRYFWHVVTSADTTVGFTQALMRKYQPEIERSLQELMI